MANATPDEQTSESAGGAVLVFFCFPRKEAEQQLLRDYWAQDRVATGPPDQ